LRFAGLGTCAPSGNEDGQFPSDADRVVIEVSGAALTTPFTAQALAADATSEGQIVFPDIPVGNQYRLRAVACDGTTTRWAGETNGVNVGEFSKTFPSIFLTPIDRVTCTGNARSGISARQLSEPRAFAALAASGEVAYALGGGTSYTVADRKLVATQTIDRYDLTSGEVSAVGATLSGPRLGALARALADGRIRVVGGTRELLFGAPGKPGIYAASTAIVSTGTELFDPTTGTVETEVAMPLAPLASMAVLPSGAIVALGGSGTQDGGYSDELAILEGQGNDRAPAPGGSRFAATLVALGNDDVLALGGNVDADLAHAALLIDAAADADGAATPLTVTGLTAVPYAASGALLSASGGVARVLIVGGGTIATGPSFGASSITTPRAIVVTVDITAQTASAVNVDLGDVTANPMTRAFGSLLALPDGDLIYFGGYTAFTSVPSVCSTPNDCVQTGLAHFRITDPGGSPVAGKVGNALDLSVGPLGSAAVPLSDGAWLMTGGLESIASTTLGQAAALIRFTGFQPDLCSSVPPSAP